MDNELCKQSATDLETAIAHLSRHMQNKQFFKPHAFRMLSGCTVDEDFSAKNMRQSYFQQCKFNKCDFFEAGFPGSVFTDCTFVDCRFSYGDFHSCCFKNCDFVFSENERPTLEATRFGKSVFQNCTFSHAILHYVDFSSCVIDGGTCTDLKCISIRIEDTRILHTKLADIRFKSQNFDFLFVQDISTENIVIPFPAVPYIFNGLQYLQTTTDGIRISSYQQGRFERINKDEYLNLIPYFETYYRESENYFPLSNIYLAQGEAKKAFEALVSGIIQSVGLKNFRMIAHYCQAIRYSDLFTSPMKHTLYNKILMALNHAALTSAEKNDMNLYMGQIKEDLLNEYAIPHIDINLATDIRSNDYQKIACFICNIESLIAEHVGKNETHHIELRHNSPVSFFIQIAADPERLVVFVAALFTVYMGAKELTRDLLLAAKKIKSKLSKLENEKNATTDSHESDEPDAGQCKEEERPTSKGTGQQAVIHIESASYCIFNCNINIIDPALQTAYIENHSETPPTGKEH